MKSTDPSAQVLNEKLSKKTAMSKREFEMKQRDLSIRLKILKEAEMFIFPIFYADDK